MKRIIFAWACLTILNAAQLKATETDSTAIIIHPDSDATPTAVEPEKSDKELITFIPDRQLELAVSSDNKTLYVELTGNHSEKLTWIIFQPKGEVISRIESQTNFNEIKVDTLNRGSYVLMVKDAKGRLLYHDFSLEK